MYLKMVLKFISSNVDLPLDQQVHVKTELGDVPNPKFYTDAYTLHNVEVLESETNPRNSESITKVKLIFLIMVM